MKQGAEQRRILLQGAMACAGYRQKAKALQCTVALASCQNNNLVWVVRSGVTHSARHRQRQSTRSCPACTQPSQTYVGGCTLDHTQQAFGSPRHHPVLHAHNTHGRRCRQKLTPATKSWLQHPGHDPGQPLHTAPNHRHTHPRAHQEPHQKRLKRRTSVARFEFVC